MSEVTDGLPDPPERPQAPTLPPLTYVRYRKFTVEDFNPILEGKVLLPNMAEVEPDKLLSRIYNSLGGEVRSGYPLTDPHATRSWQTGKFLLGSGPYGDLDGTGLVLTHNFRDGEYRIVGIDFALCRHEFEADAGYNPRRGHHFGRCKHCGYDMSVDSSD